MNPFTHEPFTETTNLGIKCLIGKDWYELNWIHPTKGKWLRAWSIKPNDILELIDLGLIVNDENYYWVPIRNERIPTTKTKSHNA